MVFPCITHTLTYTECNNIIIINTIVAHARARLCNWTAATPEAVHTPPACYPGAWQGSYRIQIFVRRLSGLEPGSAVIHLQSIRRFLLQIVPMLNPDGVIVGNYRTSLAARDLNRNYRHPRQTAFPTIWHTKQMVDSFSKDHEASCF